MALKHNAPHPPEQKSGAPSISGGKTATRLASDLSLAGLPNTSLSAANCFTGGFAALGLVSLIVFSPYPLPFAEALLPSLAGPAAPHGISAHAALLHLIEGGLLLIFLCALTWHDVRSLRLPNGLTYSVFLLGVLRAATNGWLEPPHLTEGLLAACAAAAAGCTVLLFLRHYYLTKRGIHALGLGDIKLLAGMGVWLGPFYLAPAVSLAATTGLIYAIARQMIGRKKGQTVQKPDSHQPIAFGPFLCFGFWMMWTLMQSPPLFLLSV